MAKTAKKIKDELENVTVPEKVVKSNRPHEVEHVATATIDIRTKGDHSGYLDWSFSNMPKQYHFVIDQTETGYQVRVKFKDGADGRFFVMRYMAAVVAEIRTLDECNLKVESNIVINNRLAKESTIVE